MSDEGLVGAILAEHRTNYGARGWSCECGHSYGQPLNIEADVEVHRLMSAEAVVREQVAREIKQAAQDYPAVPSEAESAPVGAATYQGGVVFGLDYAARIARGERP